MALGARQAHLGRTILWHVPWARVPTTSLKVSIHPPVHTEAEESFEFVVVSLTGQTWHFEASTAEERELWVQSVQAQILASLQGCRSAKDKVGMGWPGLPGALLGAEGPVTEPFSPLCGRPAWGTRTQPWPCRPSAPYAATASVSTAMPPVSARLVLRDLGPQQSVACWEAGRRPHWSPSPSCPPTPSFSLSLPRSRLGQPEPGCPDVY